MVPPPNAEGVPGVQAVLTVTGLTAQQIVRFIDYESITSLDNLKAYASSNTVIALVSALAKVRTAAHQVRIPQRLVEDIVALGTWVKDMHRRNRTPQSVDWDVQMKEEYKQQNLIRQQSKDLELKLPKPCPATNTAEWRPWKRETENYIASTTGVDGISLDYIIREDVLPEGYVFLSDAERRKYELVLEGPEFIVDNKKTWKVIKKLVSGTNAWPWIERFDKAEDGRGAWKGLCAFYDGPGEVEKLEAIARRDLTELKYLGQEQVFSFEKFTTKLQGCFNILEKEFNLESLKVRAMFDRIHTSHPVLLATIAVIKNKAENKNNFRNAANELSEAIAQIFPSSRMSRKERRAIYELASGGGGRGRGRGGGRGGRGRGGRGSGGPGGGRGGRFTQPTSPVNNKINGIDVSDPNRTFSPQEFRTLGEGGRKWIFNKRSGGNKRAVEEVDMSGEDDPSQKKPKGAEAGSRTGRNAYKGSEGAAQNG